MITLPIPPAVLDQHVFVPGKTRTGKSSVLRLLGEWELQQTPRIPVTFIDPKGDWWGLRSAADGKKAGFPVIIFGGEHSDVPLSVSMAVALADLCTETVNPILIDVSEFSIAERTRFMCEFLPRYFKRSRGDRRSLYVDEVHHFAPKGVIPDPNVGKMLHWMNRLASEGLGKGLRLRVASQRPQKVHNDLLTSCEAIIAMKVLHAADRKALADWFDGAGDKALTRTLLSDMSTLERGQGYVWSPEAAIGPEKVSFPLFTTYDSFKPQGKAAAPTGRANLDLDEVRKQFEQFKVEAQQNDPRLLKQRIKELELYLQKRPDLAALAEPNKETLDHEYRRGRYDAILAIKEQIAWMMDHLTEKLHEDVVGLRGNLMAKLGELAGTTDVPPANLGARKDPKRAPKERVEISGRPLQNVLLPPAEMERVLNESFNAERRAPEGRAAQILGALRWLEERGVPMAPWTQVAAIAGISPNGGYGQRMRQGLAKSGFIETSQQGLTLTDVGRAVAPEPPAYKTAFEAWKLLVTGMQRDILVALHEVGPMSRKELARRLNKSPDGGFFQRQVQGVKKIGAVVGQGTLSLAPYVSA